jgi:DNA-binding response OmpR family regulator
MLKYTCRAKGGYVMLKILIAEDDRELRQLFSHVLVKHGYTVKGVSNGKEALDAMDTDYYDIIISDIMMPVMDGYEFVRSLRDAGNTTPVMMITAKDAFDDMRMGFLSGTDDYMVKPINVNEMVLRIGALLRRAQMINDRRLVIGSTVLECDSLTVVTPEDTFILPQKEFMLLYKMASFPGKIFTRYQFMDEIWGYSTESDTHTVDVHIGRLRERFRDSKDFKIVTMRGVGYKVVKLCGEQK